MEVVRMRASPFYKVKRYISDSAVVSEVFEGVRPEQHAQSPKYLKDEANREQNSATEKIEIYSIFGCEGLPNI